MNSEEFKIPEEEEAEEFPDDKIREELLSLAEAGEIKYTTKYIKKASQETLVKIKKDYDRKQLDVTNEFISDNLISKFSDLIKNLDLVSESESLKMEKELVDNQLLKKDIKNIVGYLTPYIPYIGLLCGGLVITKHIISTRCSDKETKQQE